MDKYYFPDEIWREIKAYFIHNITIHGKHLKENKLINNYNNVIKNLPKKYHMRIGPRILFKPSLCKQHPKQSVKFVYRVATPSSIKKNNKKYRIIVEYLYIPNNLLLNRVISERNQVLRNIYYKGININ